MTEEKKALVILENGIRHCDHGEPGEPHACPYASDVHDDDRLLCTCCEACTDQCAEDI